MDTNNVLNRENLKQVLLRRLTSGRNDNNIRIIKEMLANFNQDNISDLSDKFVTKKEFDTRLDTINETINLRLNLYERRMMFIEDMMKNLGD